MRKTIVLDTNVLLENPNILTGIQKTDIIVPYKVIEELDKHKSSQGLKGLNARTCSRTLSKLIEKSGTESLKTGIKLSKDSSLIVKSHKDYDIPEIIEENNADDCILKVAIGLKKDGLQISLMSNDVLLRIKANTFGIETQGYDSNQDLQSIKDLYTGYKHIPVDDSIVEMYYHNKGKEKYFPLSAKKITKEKLFPNDYLILTNDKVDPKKKPYLLLRYTGAKVDELEYINEKKLGKLKAMNTEQAITFDLLMNKDIHLVTLSGIAGTGKAQPLDSKILTPTGWTTMEQIKVGDQVISRNGKATKVVGVFPQGKKDIYKITFSDKSSTECCKEHLWYTKDIHERDVTKIGSVKTLEQIMKTTHNISGKRNHMIPMVEPVEFLEQEISIDPYLLGVLLGDGCLLHGSTYLSTSDKEIVNYVSNNIKKYDMSLRHVSKYGYSLKRNNKIKNYISNNINIMGLNKKSHEKFVPKNYLFNSFDIRLGVLQGLLDTDGFVDKNGYTTNYYSTSEQLAKDVQFIVQSFGGKATICNKQTSYTYKNVKKLGKKSYSVYISLPKQIIPFKLSRKLERFKAKTKYQPVRFIESVELVGKKEAKCISVDNFEHLYITDNFIVTHNTLSALAAGLEQVLDTKTYQNIIVLRPMQPLGKDIGFMPGDKNEKMEPWAAPIKDNLRFLMSDDKDNGKKSKLNENNVNYLFDTGVIEIEALTFIRGRSINNTYIIIDEGQNLNAHEMKAILTRAGKDTKIIITGDLEQTDRTDVDSISNGLSVAIEKFKSYPISGHAALVEGVRSPLSELAAKIL